MLMSLKQRKIKFEPGIKLNHNIDIGMERENKAHFTVGGSDSVK